MRLATLLGSWFVYFLIAIMMMTVPVAASALSYGTLLRTQVGLLALTAAFMVARQALAAAHRASAPFALPVAALPLWVALYLDRRTAFMIGVAASFLCASLVDFRLEYVLTYLASSFTIALALRARKRAGGH